MSVQYGKWFFDECHPPPRDDLETVSALLAPYGPDTNESYVTKNVSIVYRAFHTTQESWRESQPRLLGSRAVITWDGRLDNRTDLMMELRECLNERPTDLDIVSAAYESWGKKCFSKLIGDWAVSVWNPVERSLTLAIDPMGTRHLYYCLESDYVVWCTILDLLVGRAARTFAICHEYLAGWFACFPAPHLTPYLGIHAVPPCSSVTIHNRTSTIVQYWDFDPGRTVRHRTDADYEEDFRTIFATAVRRRLRSDRPLLAELSGGMDSSSIVCIADAIIAQVGLNIPRVDTISYYDSSQEALNELPYIEKVEQKRERNGFRIDLAVKAAANNNPVPQTQCLLDVFPSDRLAATPDSNCDSWPEVYRTYSAYLTSNGYRVILSGILGETATGGYVPTPVPELQNLIRRACLLRLRRQLNAWAEKIGRSKFFLLWESVRGFSRYSLTYPWAPKTLSAPPWFHPSFVRSNIAVLSWYPSKLTFMGGLPSAQYQIFLFNHARRCLAHRGLRTDPLCEVRYPYLDRELLEFTCAIPPEQLVGVGKRRYLMKRALRGITPDELLNRKRKAASRRVTSSQTIRLPTPTEFGNEILLHSLGIANADQLLKALQRAKRNQEPHLESLQRTIWLESWLRHLAAQGILAGCNVERDVFDHRGSCTFR